MVNKKHDFILKVTSIIFVTYQPVINFEYRYVVKTIYTGNCWISNETTSKWRNLFQVPHRCLVEHDQSSRYNTIQIFLFPIKEPFRAEQLTKNLIQWLWIDYIDWKMIHFKWMCCIHSIQYYVHYMVLHWKLKKR